MRDEIEREPDGGADLRSDLTAAFHHQAASRGLDMLRHKKSFSFAAKAHFLRAGHKLAQYEEKLSRRH
jgi:hypothetical protein